MWIWTGLYGKIILEAWCPRKSFVQFSRRLPNPFLDIDVEGGWIVLDDLFDLGFCKRQRFDHISIVTGNLTAILTPGSEAGALLPHPKSFCESECFLALLQLIRHCQYIRVRPQDPLLLLH